MSKRFRIALSFAGEKRTFVSEVARILAIRFGESQILYDKYHQAEFARSDLALHLPRLYHEDADLVVAILCKDYQKKDWCGLEWNALYGLIKQRRVDEVMLSRFDRVEGEGLYGLAGFVDLDDRSPNEAARLIFQRLALNEGRDKDFYARSAGTPNNSDDADWPADPPALDWPVADHTDARRAFAELITSSARFRVLLIRGGSGTGKSHLTQQFLGNALKIWNLTCGRLDFKGSSDIDAVLRIFAEQLELPVPTTGTGISSQLGQILSSLRSAARPTLLIFDTFEMAGEAERWMKESLLLSTIRASWLRVVIVGQRLMQTHGEPWAALSSQPIELQSPSPQEWFDYGRPHTPDLTLEKVRLVHDLAMAKGGSALIAQMLGPPKSK